MGKRGKKNQPTASKPVPAATTNTAAQAPKKKRSRPRKQQQPNGVIKAEERFTNSLKKVVDAASTHTPLGQSPPTNLNKAQRYAMNLVDPLNYGSRIPDDNSSDTAFFKSVQNYEIPVVMAGDDPGSFCFAAQPKIGNPSDPFGFKLAVCDPQKLAESPNLTDWTLASSYMNAIGKVDPRMTNEIETLAFNEAGFIGLTQGSSPSTGIPLGTDPIPDAANGFTSYNYSNSTGEVNLVPGDYFAVARVVGTGTTIFTTGGSATATTEMPSIIAAGNIGVMQGWLIKATTGGSKFSFSVNGSAVTTAQLTIMPVALTNSTSSLNNGMIERVRPTAMSVLVTYIGTTLENGGVITSALVDGDAIKSRFFSESVADNQGSLRSFESISTIPGAYNGPLKIGTYAYYKPMSEGDTLYYTVEDHNRYSYPGIVCYGRFVPGDIGGLPPSPIRVSVVTCWQYTTTSQLPEKVKYKGSDTMVAAAKNFLDSEGIPCCMANGEHMAFIDKVKGLMKDVSDYIGKGLRWGKNAISTVQSYAPAVKSMLETLEPALAFGI